MAGLFDRINGADNINVHYIVAGLRGYGAGEWTRAAVLAGVNSLLDSPLITGEQDDFAAIADEMDAQSNTTSKLVYMAKVEAAMIAAESGVLAEAGWRTMLGIA